MANDVIGNIMLTVYRFPWLIQNKTLTEVFTTIVSDTAILNHVAQASGIANTTIIDAINLYLTVVSYLKPTPNPLTNSSNATLNSTQPCIPLGQGDFTAFSLLPSFFIIFVLSLLTKRRHPKKHFGVLWKRPGLCIPLNLVDDYENRLAYACAFGATVSKCLSILFFSDYQEVFSQELVKIQQDPTNPGWVGVFWKMLAMVYIGVAYYPMFACMSTEYKLIGGIIGFCYTFLWLIVALIYAMQCPKYLFTIIYPGDRFAWSLSETICIFLLVCMYFIIVVKCLVNFVRRRSSTQRETYETELWKQSYKYKYVVKLLQAIPKDCREQKALDKIKSNMYRWKPEFKYSTRVVCIYVVSLIIVYQSSIGLVIIAGFLFQLLFRLTMIYTFESIGIATSLVQQWLFIAYVAWFVALGISIIYSIILVANMLSWYREHLARLQRGDKSFLPVQVLEKSPSSITVATLKYSGYQVAYVAWSFIILHTLLFVIGSVIGIQLIYPMKQKKFNTFLWTKVISIWPAVVVSLLFYLCQFLLAKFVFLHSRGSSLALDNRRLFHICTYFLFYFNIFLGLISCLKRIIFGAVIGVLFLGRLQKSSLTRDFELRDPGFNAYVGYLYLEHTHSNPVLVTFCRLLLLNLGDEDITRPSSKIADDREAQKNCPTSDIYRDRRRKRIRNRWALFLTLSNNPELKQERKRDKFTQKSPLQALSVMVNDLTLLPAQHSPQNHVDNYGLEGIIKHDEELEHTSKL